MDSYPPEYTTHCMPLVALSGLQPSPEHLSEVDHSDSSLPEPAASRPFPSISEHICTLLRSNFFEFDGSQMPWRETSGPRMSGLLPFRIRLVDQSFTLPPRKASSSANAHNSLSSGSSKSTPHSVLSPLTPSSPAYPNILMVPEWLSKHQNDLPSAFVSFFYFQSGHSHDAAFDHQLKDQILKIQAKLSNRIFFAVAVISEKSILEAPEIEARLSAICKATGLDDKTQLFFLPPKVSPVEMTRFAATVLKEVQPYCLSYYEDLSKRAQRKRKRKSVSSAPDQPYQPLSLIDWNIRYDFKQGIFAEFCQDMELANHFYTSVLKNLLRPDGTLSVTPPGTPRWYQTRLFADITGIRIMKCFLWYTLPSAAVQFWSSFRDRIRFYHINNQGGGSSGYSWQAWEANWASVMAELIRKAQIFPPFAKSISNTQPIDLRFAEFAPPEKSVPPGFALLPWHRLHRPEYWHVLSGRHAALRLQLAISLPPEERKPPPQHGDERLTKYQDFYFGLQPFKELPSEGGGGFDHAEDISSRFITAANSFYDNNHSRMGDHARLRAAKHLYSGGRYRRALDVIKPVWKHMKWRRDRWINLVLDVLLLTHECARLCGEAEILVSTRCELLNSAFSQQTGFSYDLVNCLDELASGDKLEKQQSPEQAGVSAPISVSIDSRHTLSFLSVSLLFDRTGTQVTGEVRAQIVIHSNAQADTAPLTLTSLHVHASGYVTDIQLTHKAPEGGVLPPIQCLDFTHSEISTENGRTTLTGTADLTIRPGERRVIEIGISPRKPGKWTVLSITTRLETDKMVVLFVSEDPLVFPPAWWILESNELRRMDMIRDAGLSVDIAPRTPRLFLEFVEVLGQYYTDESILISLLFKNDEASDISGAFEVRLVDQQNMPVSVVWKLESGSDSAKREAEASRGLANLACGSSRVEKIGFIAPTSSQTYILQVTAGYYLASDPDIPVIQTARLQLHLIPPLDPRFRFSPGIHSDSWPSRGEETDSSQIKITHVWYLQSLLAPHSSSIIELEETELKLVSSSLGIECDIKPTEAGTGLLGPPGSSLAPYYRAFDILLSEMVPSVRNAVPMDFSLKVKWKRRDTSFDSATTVLSVPRFMAPPLDLRVLAKADGQPGLNRDDEDGSGGDQYVRNEYMLENPTARPYNLTVSLTPSRDFSIVGGASNTHAVHLPALSRQPVVFELVPTHPEHRRLLVQARVERRNEKLPPLYVWPTGEMRADQEGLRIRW